MLQKMIKQSIATVIAIHISIAMTGQTTENARSIIPSIPTSPQAAAFQKYGEFAINYSTGVPDISIPLYEINYRGYKLPLVLKYNPQPLKPDYNYDVFGQGWGFSVGSCISRTIEYIPDEWNGFKIDTQWFNTYIGLPGVMPSCLSDYNYARDKFHAVLPNGSEFDFTIAKVNDNLVYAISGTHPVKISCNYTPSNILSFTVIDEDGVTYTFADGDTPFSGTGVDSKYTKVNVSWQLTRIDLPNSNGAITFNYDLSIESLYNNPFEDAAVKILHYFECLPSGTSSDCYWIHTVRNSYVLTNQAYNYKMKLLTAINCGSYSVQLDYQNADKANHNYCHVIVIMSQIICIFGAKKRHGKI